MRGAGVHGDVDGGVNIGPKRGADAGVDSGVGARRSQGPVFVNRGVGGGVNRTVCISAASTITRASRGPTVLVNN